VVFVIYRRTYSIGIPVCNEYREQCQGEGAQFSRYMEYTDGNILCIYLYVMNTVNSVKVKGNNSYGLWNISTDTFRRYTHM